MQKLCRALLRRTKHTIVFFIFSSQLVPPCSLAQDTLRSKRSITVPDSQSKIQFEDTYRQQTQLLLRLLRPPSIVAAPLAHNVRFEAIDSLVQLHLELKGILLKEAIIHGALREDSMDFALKQEFASHLPKWDYGGLKAHEDPKLTGVPYNINGVPLLPPGLNMSWLLSLFLKFLKLF
ncbi:MAG: hypothetical protein HY276_07795 [Ignavibacteriales bacterium]|nr:hypothetical protein [Ignavibacteriales bacterium]